MKAISSFLAISFLSAMCLSMSACTMATSPDGSKVTTWTVTGEQINAAANLARTLNEIRVSGDK